MPEAVDMDLVKSFDAREAILKEFKDVEVQNCDVKEIQNCEYGVPCFWLKVLCMCKGVKSQISEKDRAILAYLKDITLDLHEVGFGFDLTFRFEKNSYFAEATLKKTVLMKNAQQVDKVIGCAISWTAGSDVTKTKKKKGKGKKKAT